MEKLFNHFFYFKFVLVLSLTVATLLWPVSALTPTTSGEGKAISAPTKIAFFDRIETNPGFNATPKHVKLATE